MVATIITSELSSQSCVVSRSTRHPNIAHSRLSGGRGRCQPRCRALACQRALIAGTAFPYRPGRPPPAAQKFSLCHPIIDSDESIYIKGPHSMALFHPFRALGHVADDVPFAVQRRGSETFCTVSVGTAWQVGRLRCSAGAGRVVGSSGAHACVRACMVGHARRHAMRTPCVCQTSNVP